MTQLGIQLAREYLGSNVSLATFHQWLNKYKDKVQKATNTLEAHRIEIIANNSGKDTVEIMESIRDRLLQQIQHFVESTPDIVDKASLKNATLTVAIMQDKIEKAIGMSAAMQAAIRPLAIVCAERGIDVYDYIADSVIAIQSMSDEAIEAYKNRGMLGSGNTVR